MENERSNPQVYFKEYPCYHFALYPHSRIQQEYSFNCRFEHSHQLLHDNPPAALIDTLCNRDVLYLLQWTFEQTTTLYLRELEKKQSWIKISMNLCPDHIVIAGKSIFIVAGQQLCIIVPTSFRTDFITLPNHTIVNVLPTQTQIASQNTYSPQPAAYILFNSTKNHYYACEYSLKGTNTIQPSLLTKIPLPFQTPAKNRFLHFQTVIPNVFALAFLTPTTITLFDLQKMELAQGKQIELPQGLKPNEKPVIRWKWHQKLSHSIQTILLVIGVGPSISTFFLSFQSNLTNLPQQYHNEPVSNFDAAILINCQEVQIKPSLNYILDCPILIDLAITQKGLVYVAKNTPANLIGTFSYIEMNNQINTHNQHAILNRECSIWKHHIEDIQNKNKIDQDRLLRPDRYPFEMVKNLTTESPSNTCQGQTAFYLWRNRYGFRSLLTFGEDLLIVRGCSLSVFRQVNQKVYIHQYFSQNHVNSFEHHYFSSDNHFERVIALDEANYDQFDIGSDDNLELRSERLYYQPQQDLILRQIQERAQQYKLGLDKLQNQIIFETHVQNFSNMAVQQFRYELICNRIADQLCELSLIFNAKIFLVQGSERRANKVYEKQTFITKIIDYFYGLYFRSAQHHHIFGSNLIAWFVRQSSKELPDDIDVAVNSVLQRLFLNLLPNQYFKNDVNSIIDPELDDATINIKNNPFLEFVIAKIKQEHLSTQKGQKNAKAQCLRAELSIFLKLGFFSNKSIYFNKLWRNKSLFKALLLSNQTELLKQTIFQYLLLKKDMVFILAQYKPLAEFVTKKTNAIVNQSILSPLNYNKIKATKENLVSRSNRIAIEQPLFDTNKYNLKVDLNNIIPTKNENFQNDFDEQVNNKIYEIESKLFWRDVNDRNNLVCNDHFQAIKIKFDSILNNSQYEQLILGEIKQLLNSARFNDSQHKLQFYEKMLVSYVNLFNQKLKKDDSLKYYQTKIPDSQQAGQFKQSRTRLSYILKEINEYLKHYIDIYKKHFHQTNLPTNQTQLQEKLMSVMFIEPPVRLNIGSEGFILSTRAIEIIQQILICRQMNPDEQYHDSLLTMVNLQDFFKKSKNRFTPEQVRYLEHYRQLVTNKKSKTTLTH